MADQDLRDLERTWLQTESLEDEVALLHARRVAGEIDQARLEFGAACGNLAAGRLVGEVLSPQELFSSFLFGRGERLDWDEPEDYGLVEACEWKFGSEAALRCLRALILDRKEEGKPVQDALHLLDLVILGLEPGPGRQDVITRLMDFAWSEAGFDPQDVDPRLLALANVIEGLGDHLLPPMALLEQGYEWVGAVLMEEVAPWALGFRDPVRERVVARREAEAVSEKLRRGWRRSGALEDEVAWLAQRVETGDLDRGRVRLAALCGHEASMAISGSPSRTVDHLALVEAARGLGCEALTRLAIATAYRALPIWESSSKDASPRRAIEAVEDWVLCKCEDHCAEVDRAAEQVPASLEQEEDPRRVGAARVARKTALVVLGVSQDAFLVEALEAGLSSVDICDATSRELVPWLLGYGDPIQKRAPGRVRRRLARRRGS